MWYILCLLVFLSFGSPEVYGQTASAGGRLAEIKKDSVIFEQIVEQLLKQRFDNPFALSAEPRAAYLEGYGVTVSFQLKINRATMRSIYSKMMNSPAERQSKEERAEEVREIAIEALAGYGSTFKSISENENLAICAHVEDRSEIDSNERRINLVVSAKKSDIVALATRNISEEQFRRRVAINEY